MVEKKRKLMKKEFFEVRAPITSTKIYLYGSSAQELDGRMVRLDLTRSLRGKNMELKMKIKSTESGLQAEPESLELIGSFIRRMIRKGTDYVEDSFVAETKDHKVLVKPFMITRNKVSRAVRKELRNQARKHIESYLKAREAIEVFTDIMANKIQKELSIKLKKVYPLALCEIRIFEIVHESTGLSQQK